jgi:hypothetical protein
VKTSEFTYQSNNHNRAKRFQRPLNLCHSSTDYKTYLPAILALSNRTRKSSRTNPGFAPEILTARARAAIECSARHIFSTSCFHPAYTAHTAYIKSRVLSLAALSDLRYQISLCAASTLLPGRRTAATLTPIPANEPKHPYRHTQAHTTVICYRTPVCH